MTDPVISQEHALIAHGDFGDDTRPVSIELVWVDLTAGREHGGETVVQAKAWAARDDLFSVCQLDDERTDRVAAVFSVSPQLAAEMDVITQVDHEVVAMVSDRLALVQARDQLTTEPDEGKDWTDGYHIPLWESLRLNFDALDPLAKTWRCAWRHERHAHGGCAR